FSLFILDNYFAWGMIVALTLSVMLSWGKYFMPLTNVFLDYVPFYNKFRAVASILVNAPIPIPMIWPSITEEQTQFRSAVSTKVINRFGILDTVQVEDLGSIATTRNVAYDANTGDVLLTEVSTNYDD